MTLRKLARKTTVRAGVLIAGSMAATAHGRGVSPYLPLNIEPEMQRQIERVLILADKPVLTRPIAAATVLDALPKACDIDAVLCAQVRKYLGRFMSPVGISHLSVEAGSGNDSSRVVPNRYGMTNASEWQASGQGHLQIGDYIFVNAGGVAYENNSTPAGSVVSIGFSAAQLDVGYRGHWLSPMTDSAMLISTEAPAMPSVTLSNYVPLTRLGLHYEIFAAQLSKSDQIFFKGGTTEGHPKLSGLHLSIEPVSGWALGLNRILQYGGGARGGQSVGDVLEAFFSPAQTDNAPEGNPDDQFGNQAASFTSRFMVPSTTPFSVYFEYGGEDTSRGRNYLLGNAALSGGIHFPRLWRQFDFTYEFSEWQNTWYTHAIYRDGLRNDGRILGHWGADQRQLNDDVGAQAHMVRVGWYSQSGQQLELRYRTLDNESYSSPTTPYETAHDVTLRYSIPWQQFTFGAEANAGRDVFGEDFNRIAAFVRYTQDVGGMAGYIDEAASTERDGAEVFFEAGANANEVKSDLDDAFPRTTSDMTYAPHFGLGARRAVSDRSDLGVRVEVDDIDGNMLIAVRALDYRYRFRNPLALGFFLGAARYDLATPAYGLYAGVGVQWRDLLPGWDLGADLRGAFKVARDDLLPSDPLGNRPDSFYDIQAASFYITRRF